MANGFPPLFPTTTLCEKTKMVKRGFLGLLGSLPVVIESLTHIEQVPLEVLRANEGTHLEVVGSLPQGSEQEQRLKGFRRDR